jgi:hypothetical protein
MTAKCHPRRGRPLKTHPRRGVGDVSVAPMAVQFKRSERLQEVARLLAQELRVALGEGPRELMGMEQGAQQLARVVMGMVMEEMANEPAAALPQSCEGCGGPARVVERGRPRVVHGVVGSWVVRRRYLYCARCKHGFAPWDRVLALGVGRFSPLMERAMSRAAIEVAFAEAASLVGDLTGTVVADEEVRRVAEGLGSVAEGEEQARASVVARSERLEPGPCLSDTLVIEADGCMEHVDGDWHEVKVGLVAPLGEQLVMDERAGRLRRVVLGAHYVAGVRETPDAFFARLYAQATALGLGQRGLGHVVALGDGAEWIWQGMDGFFDVPGVELVTIVDVYHAREHLWEIANAVYGRDTAKARAWAERWGERLVAEGPKPLLRALARLRAKTVEGRQAVRLGRGYFEARQDRMRYPEYVRAHLPIGSGMVESECKTLIQGRQKQAGMRWRRPGSQAIATLRARHRSGEWERFWASAPHRRRPPARHPNQVRAA